jgi:hypothetical protein
MTRVTNLARAKDCAFTLAQRDGKDLRLFRWQIAPLGQPIGSPPIACREPKAASFKKAIPTPPEASSPEVGP